VLKALRSVTIYRLKGGNLNYIKGDYVGLKNLLTLIGIQHLSQLWNTDKYSISNSHKLFPIVKVVKCSPGKKLRRPSPYSMLGIKSVQKGVSKLEVQVLYNYKRIRDDVRNATLRAEQDIISKQSKRVPKTF